MDHLTSNISRYSMLRPVLSQLSNQIETLPVKLASIAHYILDNPEKASRETSVEVAENTGCGQASVVRLTKELGFSGYAEFKVALADELLRRQLAVGAGASEAEKATRKLFDTLTISIEQTRNVIDYEKLSECAEALLQCDRIDVFALGTTASVAELLAYRLLRMGRYAIFHSDPIRARDLIPGIKRGGALIILTEMGSAQESINLLKGANKNQAYTLVITPRILSPVAKAATNVLKMAFVDPPPNGDLTNLPRFLAVVEALVMNMEMQARA